jgi:hypothetical protein
MNIEVLYTVLKIALGSLCDGRVFPMIAPAKTPDPFIVYSFESGGEADRRRRENSTLTLVIKCIARTLEGSLQNGRLIRDLLRDQGDQETGSTLPTDDEWRITTVSQGALVHMVEVWEDGTVFFHTGHQYTFTMERRTDG